MLCSVALSAQEWIDMTDSYVVNPRFDGNQTTGWTWNSNAGSQTANYEGFEFWNGDFDIPKKKWSAVFSAPQSKSIFN